MRLFTVLLLLALTSTTLFSGPVKKTTMEQDTIQTSGGPLTITFIGHGTLMLQWNGKTIQVDPWTKLADYAKLPKADLVLITHEHQDHYDTAALAATSTAATEYLLNASLREKFGKGHILHNGDSTTMLGIRIDAVPAYNTTEERAKFHPKGRDNGFVLTIGGVRLYIAGDTENTPEMEALKDVDIAFLPMNQPYTMTPAQVAHAAKAFRPKILYPYHTGETNVAELAPLLADEKGIELRVRSMK